MESSKKFATHHNIPKFYGSYDDLLADPDIDVVYIGSIADQHVKLATQSILAGKPTVVEKPLSLNAEDAYTLVNLARDKNVFFMEGMWTRCFPAMKFVKDLIQDGKIGDVVTIQGDFGWSTEGCEYPEHRIWNPKCGGMILDIGMYMAHLGQVAYGSAGDSVERVQAMGSIKHGVDHTVMANIMYNTPTSSSNPNAGYGRKGFLQFYVTGEANTEERVVIQGTKGRIIIDPPAHVPSRVTVSYDNARGGSGVETTPEEVHDFSLPDDSYTTWNYPGSIGFTHQIQDVNDALTKGLKECPSYTHQDSLQLACILDEILLQIHKDDDVVGSGNDAGVAN